MNTEVSIQNLFDAGVQWGHSSRWRHPEMTPYIWGKHQGIDIIDLRKTLPMLKKAIGFAVRIVENRGKIVVVGTKRSAQDLVYKYAREAGMPYVNQRWLGGTLTNFKTIKQSVKRLDYLESMIENNMFAEATKKERLMQERKHKKLQGALGGLREMHALPDALFVLDASYEKTAVLEANKLGIPVIAVVDSNTSIEGIQFMIPGNDDSQKVLDYYLQLFAQRVGAARVSVAEKSTVSGVPTATNLAKENKQTTTKGKTAPTQKIVAKISTDQKTVSGESKSETTPDETTTVATPVVEKKKVVTVGSSVDITKKTMSGKQAEVATAKLKSGKAVVVQDIETKEETDDA